MKKLSRVLGLILAVVSSVMFLSGCATYEGMKRDVRTLQGKALKALNPAPPPVISLKDIPAREQASVLRAVATCESEYTPPPKYYPPRGDVAVDDAIARYQYESCLQKELDEAMPLDAKYQEQVRSSCATLKGALLENCMEGIRVSRLSRKAHDVADRRDRASRARSIAARKLK